MNKPIRVRNPLCFLTPVAKVYFSGIFLGNLNTDRSITSFIIPDRSIPDGAEVLD